MCTIARNITGEKMKYCESINANHLHAIHIHTTISNKWCRLQLVQVLYPTTISWQQHSKINSVQPRPLFCTETYTANYIFDYITARECTPTIYNSVRCTLFKLQSPNINMHHFGARRFYVWQIVRRSAGSVQMSNDGSFPKRERKSATRKVLYI